MKSYTFYNFKNKKTIYNNVIYNNFFKKKINFNYILKLSSFLYKIGYKKTFLKNITQSTKNIYKLKISDEFNYNLEKDVKFRNFNYLINSIFKKSELNFKISCIEVDKKYRKKLKKKYTFQLNYLNSEKKNLFFLKNLSHIINKDFNRSLGIKIENTLSLLLKDFKKSELYKLKILTLKQLSIKK